MILKEFLTSSFQPLEAKVICGMCSSIFIAKNWIGVEYSMIVGATYWLVSNLYAICITMHLLGALQVGKVIYIIALFALLVIYDVFFVFGTNVMVTVAKGVDSPLKLMVPVDTAFENYAIMGLGDIFIPGILTCLAIRIDFINSY